MQEEIKTVQKLIDIVIDFFVNYSFQVVGAILVLVIGILVAKYVSSFLLKFFEKKEFDITLSKFIAAAVKGIILGFAFIVAIGKFGITIAPFIAALAAMAFGASFAIQGPLANYGAGLVIILTRPFVVGNTIKISDVSGIVNEVKLGATILTDEDGVKITIPNKHIVGEIIHNSEERKIVEEIVGISYGSDPDLYSRRALSEGSNLKQPLFADSSENRRYGNAPDDVYGQTENYIKTKWAHIKGGNIGTQSWTGKGG